MLDLPFPAKPPARTRVSLSIRRERQLAAPRRELLCGSTRCLTIPIVSSILEIEKESLPVRRLAQENLVLFEKVVVFLSRGDYFFVS